MTWQKNYNTTNIESNDIHLWRLNIIDHEAHVEYYWDLLSDIEKQKANKFRFKKDYVCNIIARGALRVLLGNYINEIPSDIVIQSTKHSKPYINHTCKIKFNVSHAGDCIMLAFVKNQEIGVDVELIKPNLDFEAVATSFFSKREQEHLSQLPKNLKAVGFYNCWTRKEAFIKAEGSGLSFPLDQFTVSLKPSDDTALLKTNWCANEKQLWFLESFVPYKNYVGAIAIKQDNMKILYLDYNHF